MTIEDAWNWLWRLGEDCASGARDVTVLPKVIKQESTDHLRRVIEAWNICWETERREARPNIHMQLYYLSARRELKRRQQIKATSRVEREKQERPKAGYVYLLQSPTGFYKIGRTVNPYNRLVTFSVLLPFEVEYAHLIKTDDMRSLERELHDQFSEKRVNGEWFQLAPEDVEYIKGLVS